MNVRTDVVADVVDYVVEQMWRSHHFAGLV